MKIRVAEILEAKGDFVLTISSDKSALDALEQMVHRNVGSIIVMEEGSVAGLFSERDYIRRIVLSETSDGSVPVGDVMTERLVVVDPGYNVEECMAIMTSKRIRHLPVIEDDNLVGIVSIGDCVKKLSEQAQLRIKHLEGYITGEYPH